MMPDKKKGLFDFASEHPFITLFVISDLAAMVTNVVGHICGRVRNDSSSADEDDEKYALTKTGVKNLNKLIELHSLDEHEDESHDDPKPEET